MADIHALLQRTARRSLSGKDAHVDAAAALAGLSWKLAGERPAGAPHTVFQLVNHMIYWQEWVVKWLDGKSPKPPKHAAGSWPGRVRPGSRREWERTVRRFRRERDVLVRRSRRPDLLEKRGTKTRLEMLHIIASHTSYHVGQVVFLRQVLGAWPPPAGGVTW